MEVAEQVSALVIQKSVFEGLPEIWLGLRFGMENAVYFHLG